MFGVPIATTITIIPLIGMLFLALTNGRNIWGIKSVTLWTTSFAFLFSLIVAGAFDFSNRTFTEEVNFFNKSPIAYRVGIDEFSALFVPVICGVCCCCVLWIMKHKTNKLFYISLLLFESLAIGAFYAWDMILMFLLIEATSIPLYIMMSQQKDKSTDAVLHFFVYSMISAILILIAFIFIYLETQTTNIKEIQEIGVNNKGVFWLLAIGIGIKMPIFPFYNWLPIAHVKSKTVCSVLLASIVLKFSSLLIVRFMQPLCMGIFQEHMHIALFVILLGIAFATFQLILQDDLKSLFAYFSIIHMNSAFFILLAEMKISGFTFVTIGHSILMAILFFTSHVVEKAYNSRSISAIKVIPNISKVIQICAFFAFYFIISAPLSWGFVSEIMTFQALSNLSVLGTLCFSILVLISLTFAVYVYNQLFPFWKKCECADFALDTYKKIALVVLILSSFIVGLFPKILL